MAVWGDRQTPGLVRDLLKEVVMISIPDFDGVVDTGFDQIAAMGV